MSARICLTAVTTTGMKIESVVVSVSVTAWLPTSRSPAHCVWKMSTSSDPRVLGVAELDEVIGSNDLYTGRVTLRHDTRDMPFMPTEGHLIEMSFEQAFGEFDYPRGEVDYNRYFLIRERPDGSGRHVLSASIGAGFSGSDTPLFENYFAGGFSTLRGFSFRGASPVVNTVTVGGQFRLLGSFEYMMPLTADDMIRAVGFVDYGTVEQEITLQGRQLPRCARLRFPDLRARVGPRPLAFDFAFPVAKARHRRRTGLQLLLRIPAIGRHSQTSATALTCSPRRSVPKVLPTTEVVFQIADAVWLMRMRSRG